MRTLPLAALLALLMLTACDDSGKKKGDASSPTHDLRLSELGIPLLDSVTQGKALVGDPCRQDSDCAEPPDAKCFTTLGGGSGPSISFPGGYCARACEDTDGGSPDCGKAGGCFSISGFSGRGGSSLMMCAKVCDKDADCRVAEGYKCLFIFPGLPGFCAPK